jgi:AhpD family alkylhydroperoxidase
MAEESSARVRPGNRREIGWLNAGIARLLGLAAGGKPPHVFTTIARHRGLFRRWLLFAGALMRRGKLPHAETELVILRVAHNTGCDYEWGHHERLGQRAGLSEEEVGRVREGPDAGGWSERQALLLRAVDQLHADRRIDDELWRRLSQQLDAVRLIELCMLIGHYEMLAMTLNSLAVEPEAPRDRLA